MNKDSFGFGTKAIHAGNVRDQQYGALTTPIYQSSTFVFDSCEQGGRRFAGAENGYIYTRLGNPTISVLENKIAALEGGEACLATASGMGAISSCLWTIASAGKHIIADGTLYGCSFALLNHGVSRYGVDVDFIDTSDLEALKAHLRPNTVAVYLETPANPNLKIADIAAVADSAHKYNSEIKVHGDVVAGFVVGKADFIRQVRFFGLKDMTGAVMDPFAAFLLLRGLKTLELRMARHCENARKIAAFLAEHPAVEKVNYPGLATHIGHEIAARQMKDFGGMLSFEVRGGKEAGMKLVNALRLITIAVSLGDAESLIEHPASMTHATDSPEELAASGIAPGLIRLSAGLENAEDLIADLSQALDRI